MRFVTIEGKCDSTRYRLALLPEQEIERVDYRDLTVPRPYGVTNVTSALSQHRTPPNANLIRANEPPALEPDSEIAAYWFVRAVYESVRRPVYYYFRHTQTLVCFPPVFSDGDLILVRIAPHEKSPESDNSAPMD